MDNAHSYDPRMEQMPVLISYHRSGSNWLNAIMELYFDRPRLRVGPTSFMSNRSDFMWFHDHDTFSKLKLSHNNILYLHRDPCDVIFSLLMAEHNEAMLNNSGVDELVDKQSLLLKNHYKKYLHTYDSIRYEDCKENLSKEFKKILKFFKITEPFDEDRLKKCARRVTKSKIVQKAVDKRYFNSAMLDESYASRRSNFRSKYENTIYSKVKK